MQNMALRILCFMVSVVFLVFKVSASYYRAVQQGCRHQARHRIAYGRVRVAVMIVAGIRTHTATGICFRKARVYGGTRAAAAARKWRVFVAHEVGARCTYFREAHTRTARYRAGSVYTTIIICSILCRNGSRAAGISRSRNASIYSIAGAVIRPHTACAAT